MLFIYTNKNLKLEPRISVGWLVGYEGKRNLKTEIVLKQ